jgi:hypothetical protein
MNRSAGLCEEFVYECADRAGISAVRQVCSQRALAA